jgi:hypothetical protein
MKKKKGLTLLEVLVGLMVGLVVLVALIITGYFNAQTPNKTYAQPDDANYVAEAMNSSEQQWLLISVKYSRSHLGGRVQYMLDPNDPNCELSKHDVSNPDKFVAMAPGYAIDVNVYNEEGGTDIHSSGVEFSAVEGLEPVAEPTAHMINENTPALSISIEKGAESQRLYYPLYPDSADFVGTSSVRCVSKDFCVRIDLDIKKDPNQTSMSFR